MSSLKDDAIQREVEQAIGFEPGVNVFDVKVFVRDGVVRIQGIVSTLEAKQTAERAAAGVPGVRRVDNTLTVEDPRGLKDLDIGHAVDDALAEDPSVDTHDVGARVEDSTAHLIGHADNVAQEDAAIRAASRAPGVKAAVSEIDISPGIDVDWVDLKHRVINALDDADEILPYAIDVDVETDGRVVLTGSVANEAARERAEEVARSVDGAKAVVNRLQLQ